ncbi:MAG: bifunctional (p)ppGpp synthetase/guanosine-3',5'-bis(diphosphate) 3'-pyrophosphohydrolase [Bacteroidales bacterium]|jgi:GTP pyrophosphokinase|nr:bifunctional (p)ppGpp synthetase/guanosine-3',5'-bis(diphosphate) 3'-pyrophosphohydrolase [Bacteroidales bacterium]
MYEINPELERIEINKRYRKLLRALPENASNAEKRLLRKAFNVALEAHLDARRKSGEPYIYHPLEVAYIVAKEIGLGVTEAVCAILHDVVEDSNYSLDFIEENFGSQIRHIIDGLTKIKNLPDVKMDSSQAVNFQKVITSFLQDIRVILIKFADRLHNMRTLDHMASKTQIKIASETYLIYAPLALQLGMYKIRNELSNLSLKYIEPAIYATINQQLEETEKDRRKFVENFSKPIKRELTKEGLEYSISEQKKSIQGIWSRMKDDKIPIEDVHDTFAVVIAVDSEPEKEKESCWKVYTILTTYYKPVHNRLRDYIVSPKANGYQALHITVLDKTGRRRVEVQIRSRRMNEIAEKGCAAFWRDHECEVVDKKLTLDHYLQRINDFAGPDGQTPLEFVSHFATIINSNVISVFTPKGDQKVLPNGSTVLDFAYSVHSEIGNSCLAAKVNNKLVELDKKLINGDQVEIIISKAARPQEKWLDWVITTRAKNYIREALREEKKKFTVEGKDMLQKYFNSLDIEFSKHSINKFMACIGINSTVDLYYLLAIGNITQKDIKECFIEHSKGGLINFLKRPFIKTRSSEHRLLGKLIEEKIKSNPEALLISDDLSSVNYNISNCCSPIPGDDIIGFIDPGGGIIIHRINCPEAIQLSSKFGDRIVKTKWRSREAITFLAGLRISGIDRKGLILDIMKVFSEKHNISIKSFNIHSSGEIWEAVLMIYVQDIDKLKLVINDLKTLKDIKTIFRIDRMSENHN